MEITLYLAKFSVITGKALFNQNKKLNKHTLTTFVSNQYKLIMTARNILLVATIMFFAQISKAQEEDIEKMYINADKEFYAEDFDDALPHLESIMALDSNYKDIQYLAEVVKLLTFDKRRTLDKFYYITEDQGVSDKFKDYWLGRILARRWQYDEAIAAWKQFLRLDVYKSPEIKEETRNFIDEAARIEKEMKNTGDYDVQHLSINSTTPDITQMYYPENNELIFASNRESSEFLNYFTTTRDSFNWATPTSISGSSNKERYVDIIDKYMQISSEIPANIIKDIEESNFHINDDKTIIVYTQKKKDGNSDLFMYQKNEVTGEWEKPNELPFPINTDHDEDHPFISHDGKNLYFSSNRPESIGGYDIYHCIYNENARIWNIPERLKYPINSPDNEISFFINNEQNSGFFSSDRIRMEGDYDIFQFKEITPVKIFGRINGIPETASTSDIRVKFLSKKNNQEYFIHEIEPNGSYDIKVIHKEPYLVEVIYHDSLLHKETFDLTGEESYSIVKNINILSGEQESLIHDEVKTGTVENAANTSVDWLSSKFRSSNVVVASHIYFDYGQTQPNASSNQELEEILSALQNSPDMKIEISGHTDNTGPHDFNMELSQSRAEAIKNWLVNRGINAERIQAIGYGETRPMASNDDEKDGRELNRRIEIRRIDSE